MMRQENGISNAKKCKEGGKISEKRSKGTTKTLNKKNSFYYKIHLLIKLYFLFFWSTKLCK